MQSSKLAFQPRSPKGSELSSFLVPSSSNTSPPLTSPYSSTSSTPDSLYQRLRHEFRIFCETTTIRGVSRIAKAPSRAISIFWSSIVISLFVGLFCCMLLLLRQYREYDVIHPPRVLRDAASPFPSITLCNLRAISPRGKIIIEKKGWKTPRSFALSLNKFGIHYFYNAGEREAYRKLTMSLTSGYFESIEQQYYPQLGYTTEDMVIHCSVTYMNGSKRVYDDCRNVGNWTRLLHVQYLNCHMFKLNPHLRETARSLELYLYLDEDLNATQCIDCYNNSIKSQLSGATVSVDAEGAFPDLNQGAINLQPGTLTEIKLKTIQNIQKAPPYGRCSVNTPKYLTLYDKLFTYSEYACKFATIQQDINENCHCNVIEYPILNMSLPFCSELSAFLPRNACEIERGFSFNASAPLDFDVAKCKAQIDQTLQTADCRSLVTSKYVRDVVEQCTIPCAFFSYESDRSTSSWPTKSWQLFWANRIPKWSNKPEFSELRRAYALDLNGSHEEALRILRSSEVLERNLLAILISRPNFNLHKVEEKEVISLTSFLSQSGGLCSIWVGLTMVSVVEIVELFLKAMVLYDSREARGTVRPMCSTTEHLRTARLSHRRVSRGFCCYPRRRHPHLRRNPSFLGPSCCNNPSGSHLPTCIQRHSEMVPGAGPLPSHLSNCLSPQETYESCDSPPSPTMVTTTTRATTSNWTDEGIELMQRRNPDSGYSMSQLENQQWIPQYLTINDTRAALPNC